MRMLRGRRASHSKEPFVLGGRGEVERRPTESSGGVGTSLSPARSCQVWLNAVERIIGLKQIAMSVLSEAQHTIGSH
jgi:hypothetical protein